MSCPNCNRESRGDGRFCTWCEAFIIDASARRAGLFPRLVATFLDAVVGWGVVIVALAIMGQGSAGALIGLALIVGVIAGWFMMWARGVTPGKYVLGLRVIRTDGSQPGVPTMLLREWIGKYIDGLILGIGWLWAIVDRDRQAWHDKIAGTVVVAARKAT